MAGAGLVVGRLAPGVGLAAVVAAGAFLATQWLPGAVGPVLVAVVVGLVVGNLIVLPARVRPGLAFATRRLLRAGVVLLGAKLSLGDVAAVGLRSVGMIVACMAVAFVAVGLGARLLHVPPRLAVLLAVGTAVCGNSAIVATSPIIEADERDISFAVGTITVLGTVALLVFPAVGHALAMGDTTFGYWAGLAVNDTSQVLATSAAYSAAALEVATVVKLVRNALMAPVLLGVAWWARRHGEPTAATPRGAAREAMPLFVLGFLALAALRSTGALSADVADILGDLATVLVTVAIAAVALGTRWSGLRTVGAAPFVTAATATVALAIVAWTLAAAL